MIKEEDTIKIGKFQKTHALKGELNALLDIDPEYFIQGNPLILPTDGILVPYYVESVRNKGSFSFLIKIEGIDSEEAARQFVNKEILMLKEDAADWIEEDETDIPEEFIGYKVIDKESGTTVGEITDIDTNTQNVLFILSDGDDEIFIPASDDFIVEIDDDKNEIIMNLPEGLVNLNKKE